MDGFCIRCVDAENEMGGDWNSFSTTHVEPDFQNRINDGAEPRRE
jgi:hypothetical protein